MLIFFLWPKICTQQSYVPCFLEFYAIHVVSFWHWFEDTIREKVLKRISWIWLTEKQMEVTALRVLFYATQLPEGQDQVSSALPSNLSWSLYYLSHFYTGEMIMGRNCSKVRFRQIFNLLKQVFQTDFCTMCAHVFLSKRNCPNWFSIWSIGES